MALYTALPVYKRTYQLLMELITTCALLPRLYKHTFGERIQEEAIEMVLNIYKSNSSYSKVDYIGKAREHVETLRLLIRLLYDTKKITQKRMIYLNTYIEDISKQLTGWQKSSGTIKPSDLPDSLSTN